MTLNLNVTFKAPFAPVGGGEERWMWLRARLVSTAGATTWALNSRSQTNAASDHDGWSALGWIRPTGPSVSQTTPQTVPEYFTNCLRDGSANGQCLLEPGEFLVTKTLEVHRSNIVVSGQDQTSRYKTKLIRAQAHTGPILSIAGPVNMGVPEPITGVVLQNMTLCGGSILSPNSRDDLARLLPPGAAPDSQASCPPMSQTDQTECGKAVQAYPNKYPPPPADPIGGCIDIDITNVTGTAENSNPAPFNINGDNVYNGPYAVTIYNVAVFDSPGHAISIYAWGPSPNGAEPVLKVNDVYIHDSTISYSEVTGILTGSGYTNYDYKYCDNFAGYANSSAIHAPRNIRIENNYFTGHKTGAMGSTGERWMALRSNYFLNNYLNPQVGNPGGGTIQVHHCSDTIQITGNTFIGPGAVPVLTDGMELYGRNMVIGGGGNKQNTISNYPAEGIGGHSLYYSTFKNNYTHHNSLWSGFLPTGGIKLVTAFGGGCGDVPRDLRKVDLIANRSENQRFGIHFADQDFPSRNVLWDVTVTGDNTYTPFGSQPAAVARDGHQIKLPNYSGIAVTDFELNPLPRSLPVDTELRRRCSSPGASREKFTFPASDNKGREYVRAIVGIFSLTPPPKSDTDPGPTPVGACYFHYDTATKTVYLAGANGATWAAGSSRIGPLGQPLENGVCKIHAESSSELPYNQSEPHINGVTLDIEFLTQVPMFHIYSWADNTDGQSRPSWNYFGWWSTY
ncbi:MAG: hypothetical protein U0Q16_33855 [Bryobacteraceae bacterium]